MNDFEKDKVTIKEFLTTFELKNCCKYMDIINRISSSENPQNQLEIDLKDLFNYQDLLENILNHTKRYSTLFYQVIDDLMPFSDKKPSDDASPLQVLIYQRMQKNEISIEESKNVFPPILTRKYTLGFKPFEQKQVSVREIGGAMVGKYCYIRGIVTRVSNVKPLCIVSAYACDQCGNEVFQEISSQSMTPLNNCPSSQCLKNNIKGRLHLQTRGCKFLKFQELKLQELPDQVPMGHIPRSMTVYLLENQTRQVSPGETVAIGGTLLPIPFTGYKALKAGLITDTYLEAHYIHKVDLKYSEMEVDDQITEQINYIVQQPGIYERLASSLAPEIYGHEDVKKALLLMLVGGTGIKTPDGMKIRGDLNICLMGDPGVAKSQLLKHIVKIAPRAVYTTGRGSSGVGLTASVMRDPVTEEMVLEGGALVLADNGIACIDEFDKMDESDRTAIHEVMEQQTISISKAGITTTLNARTSILAAANPKYGRYNPGMKPTDNINLPAALLSRFDLLFLLLDKPSIETDLRLAQHVTYVHRCLHHPPREEDQEPIGEQLMKSYISVARSHQPLVPPRVGDYLVNAYVHTRQQSESNEFQYTCARTLLSVVRLSTALARLRFATEVEISDVDEALRLIDVSKSSLVKSDKKRKDPISAVFDIIREMSTRGNGSMEKEILTGDVRERVLAKGFSETDLTKCLDSYAESDIWMITADGSRLRWLSIEEDEDEDDDEDL